MDVEGVSGQADHEGNMITQVAQLACTASGTFRGNTRWQNVVITAGSVHCNVITDNTSISENRVCSLLAL